MAIPTRVIGGAWVWSCSSVFTGEVVYITPRRFTLISTRSFPPFVSSSVCAPINLPAPLRSDSLTTTRSGMLRGRRYLTGNNLSNFRQDLEFLTKGSIWCNNSYVNLRTALALRLPLLSRDPIRWLYKQGEVASYYPTYSQGRVLMEQSISK